MNWFKNNKNSSKELLIASMVIAVAMTIVAGFGIYKATEYKNKLKSGYSLSYGRAVTTAEKELSNLSADLERSLYCSSSRQKQALASKIAEEAKSAKTALLVIPHSEERLINTDKFLSQAGSFAREMSSKLSLGENLSNQEIKSLKALSKNSKELKKAAYNLKESLKDTKGFSLKMDFDKALLAFEDAENALKNSEPLSYKGKYSDNSLLSERRSIFLKNEDEVAEDHARKIAADCLKISVKDLPKAEMENSNLPAFVFSNDEYRIAVTKKGGYVSYFIKSNESEEKRSVSKEDAVAIAQEKLTSLGYGTLKPCYFQKVGNFMMINFSHEEGDVSCYLDSATVSVSLKTGEVMSLDARSFLLNHRKRSFPESDFTFDDAKKLLSSDLTEKKRKKVLIPKNGMGEVFSYEFLTENENGDEILVYINAANGNEEKILMLMEDENGMYVI